MNLLITGAWSGGKAAICELKKTGHSVQFLQQESESLPCPYDWVEAVVCNGLFLHHPIEKFTNLKYIQLTSAGFDRVPMDYVRKHHIEIFNARGVYSIPMAEFALCGVLQLYKQSHFFFNAQHEHRWEKHRGLMELLGKTVCIVGCGSVGTECAKRFSAFGCRVTGVDIDSSFNPFFEKKVPLASLENVLPCSDIVILTLPLTEQTHHLMNEAHLSLMKKDAVLVNIARGAIVDTFALIYALQSNLGGAVLDVFEEEPLDSGSPLWDMEHVLITPHNSFVGDHNADRLKEIIFENLKVFAS